MNGSAVTDIKQAVANYVNINAYDKTIDNDTAIFELGYVSSLFAIDLMCFLEKKFSIKIRSTDLDLDNFKTINKICEFVELKIIRNREVNNERHLSKCE